METKRTRRTFTHEFKKQAAERVIVGKEKATAVAQELGINPVSLYQWMKDYEHAQAQSEHSGSTPATPSTSKEETAASTASPASTSAPSESVHATQDHETSAFNQAEEKGKLKARIQENQEVGASQPESGPSATAQSSKSVDQVSTTSLQQENPTIKTKPSTMNERPQEPQKKPAVQAQPEGFQIKFCTIHPSKEEAIKAGQDRASKMQAAAAAKAAAAKTSAQSQPPSPSSVAPKAPMPQPEPPVSVAPKAPVQPEQPISVAPKAPPVKQSEPPIEVAPKAPVKQTEPSASIGPKAPMPQPEPPVSVAPKPPVQPPEPPITVASKPAPVPQPEPEPLKAVAPKTPPTPQPEPPITVARAVPTPQPVPPAPTAQPTPTQQVKTTTTLNLPNKNKRNNLPQDRSEPYQQRSNVDTRKRVLDQPERFAEPSSNFISDFSQSSEPPAQPYQEQYQERNGRDQSRDFRQQKQKKNKQYGNDRFQNRNENRNENRYENRVETEEAQPEKVVPERPPRPVPTAAEGRSWKVKGALEQRPNYREENEKHGYVDEFNIPAKNLNEVWQILSIMQESVDKRAFSDMVHARQLNVPDEVLDDPKACTMQGPNIPNKPWLRKPRMHQAAEEFFQTTPEYAKAVYENYCGVDIRLDKNSDGTPILSVQNNSLGERTVTIDFTKFDRFVDDFYGDFVKECKEVMMKRNPREYSSLNSFIRIPDEPLWNPKLWAGVRTFVWRPGESLSEAWINYASNQRKNQRFR